MFADPLPHGHDLPSSTGERSLTKVKECRTRR
jgi:hypothetical protein